MGASYMNKNQGQPQVQPQGRRPNDGSGRGGNMNYQSGDAGRNYGRAGWGRGGQGVGNQAGGGGPMRGRRALGVKNMGGSSVGAGNGAYVAGAYGQAAPTFGSPAGGMMHPQGMMGAGFDPTYTGRGVGYGGFPGPSFPGMLPSFPAVNTMGIAGVAPHVNPAFFGHGMALNGMGIMGSSAMDGPHAGMWTDTSMGGWVGGEEMNTVAGLESLVMVVKMVVQSMGGIVMRRNRIGIGLRGSIGNIVTGKIKLATESIDIKNRTWIMMMTGIGDCFLQDLGAVFTRYFSPLGCYIHFCILYGDRWSICGCGFLREEVLQSSLLDVGECSAEKALCQSAIRMHGCQGSGMGNSVLRKTC
ncbi:hypothetical protein DITRI_Ditri12bG0055300 [Diplodiscus trichospermus]